MKAQRGITSEQRQVLAAEYSSFPQDTFVTDRHVAARASVSRSHVINMRVKGEGPKFLRSETGQVRYLKADVEAWLSSFKKYSKTSEYAEAA